jgi:hypothetical protein
MLSLLIILIHCCLHIGNFVLSQTALFFLILQTSPLCNYTSICYIYLYISENSNPVYTFPPTSHRYGTHSLLTLKLQITAISTLSKKYFFEKRLLRWTVEVILHLKISEGYFQSVNICSILLLLTVQVIWKFSVNQWRLNPPFHRFLQAFVEGQFMYVYLL